MKVEEIRTVEDANAFCDGVINDFESGVSDKSETLELLGSYTGRIMEIFWDNAQKILSKKESKLPVFDLPCDTRSDKMIVEENKKDKCNNCKASEKSIDGFSCSCCTERNNK